MRVAISQPRYLPAVNYLQRIVDADKFVLLDNVQHQKRAFEHRNRIRDERKEHWLSIPIDRSAGAWPLISELKVTDHSWVEDHTRKLEAYYGKSRYFDKSLLAKLYEGLAGAETLTDIVQVQLERILDLFGFSHQGKLIRSSSLGVTSKGSKQLADITRALGGTVYISGPNGRSYIKPEDFSELEVAYHEYDFPIYDQQGPTFIPWLAWIDAYFNVGPELTKGMILEHGRFSPT